MTSAKRQLGILRLFSQERSIWTAEEAAPAIGVSVSTCYRYINSLCQAGMLDPVTGRGYALGPAFIEYDRLIQMTDPLLSAAKPAMKALSGNVEVPAIVLLCRLYQEQVMCIHQETDPRFTTAISYERGRPMPLFEGATSKIILSNLPARALRRLYDQNAAAAGLADWDVFRREMRQIRKLEHCVTCGSINAGILGIAAPVFSGQDNVLGSLSLVAEEEDVSPDLLRRLIRRLIIDAREISDALTDAAPQRPARIASQATRRHNATVVKLEARAADEQQILEDA